ncbi:hypothetical protein [Sandaracinobacteroides saxicola]|uniref:Flagellin n=1 Tax=Sandaracinobacteroides saxicola TaxID=2759707 RepID=A0A7G5IFW4_9SPHN|nr:hypothetical protein [Sandaracinobacteroides saxicola]QMW22256.1 hypothetical protein H3309_12950 [Sandaracinobacteroides saxicola]
MRISSMTAQQAMAAAVSRNLAEANRIQEQLATGKESRSYAGLKLDAATVVTSRAISLREAAYQRAADRATAAMDINDMHVGSLYESARSLRTALLSALGTGDSAGARAGLESLFSQARASLNARGVNGTVFSTMEGSPFPFSPRSLAELAALPNPDIFTPGAVRMTMRLGDDQLMPVGLTAREVGGDLVYAMHRLARIDLSGTIIDPADKPEIEAAIGELDVALEAIAGVRADNGRRLAEVDRLAEQSRGRALLMDRIVSAGEDVDAAKASTQLLATQSALEASYAVFGRFRDMSLADFLR